MSSLSCCSTGISATTTTTTTTTGGTNSTNGGGSGGTTTITPTYEVEGVLLYNFLTQLSTSNPPSLFIDPSFKTNIATVKQNVLSTDISIVRTNFSKYYLETLLGAISTNVPFFALSDQENIDLYDFLDIFLKFFTTFLNTFSYYVQEYKNKNIDILNVLNEIHQASVIVGGVISSLKKYLTQRVSVGKIITFEESAALNQSLQQFKSAITSFDFILTLPKLYNGSGSGGTTDGQNPMNICNSVVNFGSGSISLATENNKPRHSYQPTPCYRNGFDQSLLNMIQTFYGSCGPCFLVDTSKDACPPTAPKPPVYSTKPSVVHVWYTRPLSLVKRIPTLATQNKTLSSSASCNTFSVYFPEKGLSSLRDIFIPRVTYSNFYLLMVEEAMPEGSGGAIGYLLSSEAWTRRAENTSAWLVSGKTEIMMERKRVPFLVLDVKRNKLR